MRHACWLSFVSKTALSADGFCALLSGDGLIILTFRMVPKIDVSNLSICADVSRTKTAGRCPNDVAIIFAFVELLEYENCGVNDVPLVRF